MRRPWLFGLAIAVVVAVIYLSGLLEVPESRTLDLRFDLRGPRAPSFPIALVTVDDDSLAEMNLQWPWPRSLHAELLERIAAGKPLAIGVDILFVEESRPAEDERLGEAVARAGRVVLAASLRSMATQTAVGVTQQREMFEPPIPTIRRGAAGIGFVELDRGQDAFVRAGALSRRHAGQLHASFTARLFALAAPALHAEGSRAAQRQRVWVNFRGPSGTFPTYPYYQVVSGEIPPETFAGKIVLVGVDALSLHDRHPTPFSGASWLPTAEPGRTQGPDSGYENLLMPGTEIQANLLDTLLRDDPIRRFPPALSVLLILLVGTAAAAMAGHLRPLRAIAASVGLGIGYLGLTLVGFIWGNLWLEAVPVTLALGVSAGGVISWNYMREERVRREYARFFSPGVARQIAEDRSGEALAG
ncbi:MAG TPA: CHASE2 domain-containing protein, partial [Candidatus Sulfotelmatobacter sp.]|nr:CHASE2 domain-containing protein [Candidatus Sulfotelmatobacter sp.]